MLCQSTISPPGLPGCGPSSVGDPIRWDGTSTLYLAHLGDTEGDITFTANPTVANLTLPEISGQAVYEATYTGEGPVLNFPLFFADPDLIPIISPIGLRGAGHVRVRDVAERTVVVFPEDLFRDGNEIYQDIRYVTGTGWEIGDGVGGWAALDAAQQVLLGLTIWCWRGYFQRPDRMYLGGHGDDGKNIVPIDFNLMMHPSLPDGQRLYTLGDPSTAENGSIDISGGS